jgi:hypothetical protein
LIKSPIILVLALVYSNLIFSQELTVKYTEEKIEIDGSPFDSAWNNAESSTDFWQWRPTDSVRAVKQTEFKALFDNENIYFFSQSIYKR